jgi:hypothetical protein
MRAMPGSQPENPGGCNPSLPLRPSSRRETGFVLPKPNQSDGLNRPKTRLRADVTWNACLSDPLLGHFYILPSKFTRSFTAPFYSPPPKKQFPFSEAS